MSIIKNLVMDCFIEDKYLPSDKGYVVSINYYSSSKIKNIRHTYYPKLKKLTYNQQLESITILVEEKRFIILINKDIKDKTKSLFLVLSNIGEIDKFLTNSKKKEHVSLYIYRSLKKVLGERKSVDIIKKYL